MKQGLTVRIPEDLRKDLLQISEKEDKPLSTLVRESLRRYVDDYVLLKIRARTIPFAEAQGLYTDEDIFNLIS